MPDPKEPSDNDPLRMSEVTAELEEDELEEYSDELVDIGYRGRGRPKLPPEMKRREKLTISLTAAEYRRIMIKAANEKPKPLRIQDLARRILLDACPETEEGE